MAQKQTVKQALERWEDYHKGLMHDIFVDDSLTQRDIERRRR